MLASNAGSRDFTKTHIAGQDEVRDTGGANKGD